MMLINKMENQEMEFNPVWYFRDLTICLTFVILIYSPLEPA